MEEINLPLVIGVGLLALALIVFVIYRNKRDRKKLGPKSTDPVAEDRISSTRSRDSI